MTHAQEVLLIRHGAVESRWKNICYGAMDVALSKEGEAASDELAEELLQKHAPRSVFHSGLSRTRYLAERIAKRGGEDIQVHADGLLQERNYGRWQGRSWDEAYSSDPERFHDLIEKPESYRPPGGETTSEMQHRMVRWLDSLETLHHLVVAVSHSGPITALAGYLLDLPPNKWEPWMPRYLEAIRLTKHADSLNWSVEKRYLT